MPEPIDDLRNLIATPEFEAVHNAVLALPSALLIDPTVGAHFGALRTGLLGVVSHIPPLPEPEPEMDTQTEPGEGEGESSLPAGDPPAGEPAEQDPPGEGLGDE